jgi:hypothetical protein
VYNPTSGGKVCFYVGRHTGGGGKKTKKPQKGKNRAFLLFVSVFIRFKRSYLCSESETKGKIILVLSSGLPFHAL